MWFAEVLQTKPLWFDSKLWQLFKGLLPFCCLALFMTQDSYRANVSFCTGVAWRTCCLSHIESLYKCCEAFVIFSSGAKVLIQVFFPHKFTKRMPLNFLRLSIIFWIWTLGSEAAGVPQWLAVLPRRWWVRFWPWLFCVVGYSCTFLLCLHGFSVLCPASSHISSSRSDIWW